MRLRVEHVKLMMKVLPTKESRKHRLVCLDEKNLGDENVVFEFEYRPNVDDLDPSILYYYCGQVGEEVVGHRGRAPPHRR